MPAKKRYRPDMDGGFKSAYQKAKARILAKGGVCAICGLPVDTSLKFPDPYSPSVDHIIPIIKGGDPANPDNLQLTHLVCNQVKGSRLTIEANKNIQKQSEVISNRVLPLQPVG